MLTALTAAQFNLLLSEPLLAELAEVLSRPRITRKYGVTRADIRELVTLLRERGTDIVVVGDIHLCRDADDDVILETAIRGNADTVVSRDEDIKGDPDVAQQMATAGIEVMSVARFLRTLDEREI